MNQNVRYFGMIAALAVFVFVTLTVLFPGGKWRWAQERQNSMTEETVVLPPPLPSPPKSSPTAPSEPTPSGTAKRTPRAEERPSNPVPPKTEAPQQIPPRPVPIEPQYTLVVFAGGSVIDRNESISINSTRLKTLGFTVQYDGPNPRPDNIRIEWWVSPAITPVLSSPERVQDGALRSASEVTSSGGDRWSSFDYPAGSKELGLLEHYDNKPVPGSYEVRLLINGRAMQTIPFKITSS